MEERIKINPSKLDIWDDVEMKIFGVKTFPKVVALTGATRSGKTNIANRLVAEYQYTYISVAKILQDYARKLGFVETSWIQLGRIGMTLRSVYGTDVLARIVFEKILSSPPELNKFVIDAVLHPAEIINLFDHTELELIGIQATSDQRIGEEGNLELSRSVYERDVFEQVNNSNVNTNAPDVKSCLEIARDRGCFIVMGEDTISHPSNVQKVSNVLREINSKDRIIFA